MSSLEPKVFNLCDLYSRAVQQTPHHVAVEHEEGTLTYLELDSASCALASHLADLGVGHTSKVPLLTSLGTLNIVAILGILKTGACYVPLDRTTWSKDRIDQVMNLIDSPVVVNTTAEPFCAGTWHEVHLRDAAILQALQANKGSYSRTSQISGDDLACIIFTSGSTGKPKGVMIRHQSVANYAQMSPFNMDVKPGDRVLHILSVAFDGTYTRRVTPTGF
jgi:non-ribosomal peptide synthetase component F